MKISSWHSLLILICFVTSSATFLSCLKEANLPTLTTIDVSNIKTLSAVSGGTITDDGGAEINVSGVCWGTADNPTRANSISVSREETGSYDCILFGLTPDTYYHVRAFAKNRVGTAYGNEVHFRTKQIVEPRVTTAIDTSSISLTSVAVGGNIVCDDETTVIGRGFCLATMENPTTENWTYWCGAGAGSFKCNLSPLQPGTLYHVRAFATTIVGITYGADMHFITSPLPTVTINAVTIFTRTSARVEGNLINGDIAGAILDLGICFGTAASPTVKGYYVSCDTFGDDGVFTCTLTNLTPGTLYYVRAYITAVDWIYVDTDYVDFYKLTQYGNEVTFTTSQ
jgi:hypothetical protein